MSACGASSSTGRNGIVCRNVALAPATCYSTTMNTSRCQFLVAELERDPDRVPAYYSELESAIRWLMDTTFAMRIGETVVVGTSKLNGGSEALVVLLTAKS